MTTPSEAWELAERLEQIANDNTFVGRNDHVHLHSAAAALRDLAGQVESLRAAIAKHHAQHADDMCWMDDDELYAVAGLPKRDATTGDPGAMLQNCKRFIQQRCKGAGEWKSYAELEAECERLRAEVEALKGKRPIIDGGDDANLVVHP